jgi:hypothetical protein
MKRAHTTIESRTEAQIKPTTLLPVPIIAA